MRRARFDTCVLSTAKWIGTAAGIAGAILIALNLGIVAYGFGLFLVSSLLWGWVGWMHRGASLVLLQSVLISTLLVARLLVAGPNSPDPV